MTEYLNFLRTFLTDLDLTVDGNDYIRYNDDAKTPILVEGRRLVLPTENHRRNPADDKYIFHPLNENTVADLSPVIKELMRLAATNLNILFATYATEIIRIASDTGLQKQGVTDKQLDLISKLKSCKSSDEKDVANIAGRVLLKYAQENQISSFIQIGLTRGRVYRGEKRHRAGSVTFPFYEQLLKDCDVPRANAKIDVSKDVRQTLIEVYETIFPAVGEEEAYGYAEVTNRTIAPFFVTLAKSYAQLAAEFKRCQRVMEGLVHFSAEEEAPRLDWLGDLDDIDLLRKWSASIPDQSTFRPATISNGGSEYKAEPRTQAEPVQTAQPAPTPAPTPAPAPVPAPTGSRVIDPDDFVRTYSSGTAFAATQHIKTQLKNYINGYKAYWDDHLARYNTAPANFPHPTVVPAGQLPPQYPGAPALPMGFYPGGPANVMSTPQIGTGMAMGYGGMPMQQMMMPGMAMPMQQMQQVMGPNGMPMMVMANPMGGINNGAMVQGQAYNPMAMNYNANPSAHPLFQNTAVGAGSVAPGCI